MRYMVREKIFHLGEDNDITDDQGRPVLRVDGKALSLRSTMSVLDLAGNEVASVHRKLVSAMPQYEVDLPGTGTAVVHRRFSNPLRPKWTIEWPGQEPLELRGNLLGHDFTVQRGGTTVATVSKAWVSWSNTYGVDVAPGENDLLILCSVLALEAEADRQRN
jgi:uncharacterized protein YxjI